MERTVPHIGSEEVDLYLRTYYSLLRSTHPIQLQTLVESHLNMDSLLHIHSRSPQPDVSALVYTSLRLPPCMPDVELFVLGQSDEVFSKNGYQGIGHWRRASAPGRRRRMYFDGESVVAAYIASRSDIDDLIPALTGYQIEWNKLHSLLRSRVSSALLSAIASEDAPTQEAAHVQLADVLGMPFEDLQRLRAAWGESFVNVVQKIAEAPKNLRLQLLSGSLAHYRKATRRWWDRIDQVALEHGVSLSERPVYFISSNMHALPNLLTGYARRHEEDLLAYLRESQQEGLLKEYELIASEQAASNHNNLLYYVLKKYVQDGGEDVNQAVRDDEQAMQLLRIPSKRGFDIEAQIVELRHIRPEWLDQRVQIGSPDVLTNSDAVILNIDYPLGMAAYELLNEVAYQVGELLGVYVMGKAASLNGRIGDIMIPGVVHDEHSQNTFLFGNCFAADDVAPYLTYSTVLDNQKAISARGTFLQNSRYMSVFYREGYTDIEMEAGPYLAAVYEAVRPKRHPYNEIVDLHHTPFDVGFLHYASDTPMTKGHNLGAGSMSYAGVDPTYATAIAILNRILQREVQR